MMRRLAVNAVRLLASSPASASQSVAGRPAANVLASLNVRILIHLTEAMRFFC